MVCPGRRRRCQRARSSPKACRDGSASRSWSSPKPGAGGTLAAAQIARATPDGYTLGFIPSWHAVTAAMYKSLPYQSGRRLHLHRPSHRVSVRDRHPRRASDPHHAGSHQGREGARRRRCSCGAPGQGSPQHLLIEYISRLAGIKLQPVPFRGGNQALTELLGKRIDFLIDPPIALIGTSSRRAARHRGDGRRALLRAAGCRHHRRGRLPGLLRHLLDGRHRAGQAAGPESPRGSTRRSPSWSRSLRWPNASARWAASPKLGPPDHFRTRIAADIARWNKVVADAGIERI